jgi:hypothetical protein
MILLAKRLAPPSPKRLRAGRSKAPSTASLSPGQLEDGGSIGFDFLPAPIATQPWRPYGKSDYV